MITRRGLLLGTAAATVAGATAAVTTDLLPVRVRTRLGLSDEPDVAVPDLEPGRVTARRLSSGAESLTAYPPGRTWADGLAVCVVLHGRGGRAADAFGEHALHRFLAQVAAEGTPPFALAALDGGEASYWHGRRDGRDPAAAIDELLDVLGDEGHDTSRIGLTGWSMGGYGALLAGARLGPQRVAAVVADSPALFRRFGDARPGAFDDRADYDAHDVFARTEQLRALRVRITCGRDDPFLPAARAMAERLPGAQVAFGAGGHTPAYWRSVATDGLRFVGRALAAP